MEDQNIPTTREKEKFHNTPSTLLNKENSCEKELKKLWRKEEELSQKLKNKKRNNL